MVNSQAPNLGFPGGHSVCTGMLGTGVVFFPTLKRGVCVCVCVVNSSPTPPIIQPCTTGMLAFVGAQLVLPCGGLSLTDEEQKKLKKVGS